MPALAAFDAPLDSSGSNRGEADAPTALRAAGALERWGALDAGAIEERILDDTRDPATGVIGADDLRRASAAIAAHVRALLDGGRRPLVLGGDCSLLLGVALAVPAGCGLWFVDGHPDFHDGASSPTGEAADMDLGILTGNGPALVARPGAPFAPAAVVVMGHRPDELDEEAARENRRIDPGIEAVTAPDLRERGPTRVAEAAVARLAGRPAWLHIDLDVLDQAALPAVSYPQDMGLDWDELLALLAPLAAAPWLIGISLADFNPDLDPEGVHARRIVDALAGPLRAAATSG